MFRAAAAAPESVSSSEVSSDDPPSFRFTVAAPCLVSWDGMSGDERARFCGECQKNVYNLSTMSATEVATLVREKEGGFCGRFYRRADGTVLTADCAPGQARARRRRRRSVWALVALLFGSCGALFAGALSSDSDQPTLRQLRAAVTKMKVWIGLQQPEPMPLMGEVCIVPPAAPLPTAPLPTGSDGSTPANSAAD